MPDDFDVRTMEDDYQALFLSRVSPFEGESSSDDDAASSDGDAANGDDDAANGDDDAANGDDDAANGDDNTANGDDDAANCDDEMLAAALNDYLDSGPQVQNDKEDDAWWPWPNKVFFFLDVLDHIPRVRISDRMLRLIMWLLKKCDVYGVPSFNELRACQQRLQGKHGITTSAFSKEGKKDLHVNDPRDIVGKDWSNPSIRKHLQLYPDINQSGEISEIWHGSKWAESKHMPPMWENRQGVFFYVGEACGDGENLWKALRWWQSNRQQYFLDAIPLNMVQTVSPLAVSLSGTRMTTI